MADESIIEKVRKCWALAEHPNTPQHEKELALTRAHELMARHNIDMAVLQEAKGTREAVIFKDVRLTENGRKVVVKNQRMMLAAIVARNNRCKCIIVDRDDTVDVDTGKVVRGGVFMTLVGFSSDVTFVQELYWALVMNMMEAASHEAIQTDNYKANFCEGYASRIDDRLREASRNVEAELAPSGSSTALVLVSRSEQVEQALNEKFPSLKKVAMSKVKFDPNAAERGRRAANNADIGQTKLDGRGKGIGTGGGGA